MAYDNNARFTGRITFIERAGGVDAPLYNIRMAVPESNMVDGSRLGYINIKAFPATYTDGHETWVYDPWAELTLNTECTIYCLARISECQNVELVGVNVSQPEEIAKSSIKISTSRKDKKTLENLAKASHTSVSELIHTWISEKSEG